MCTYVPTIMHNAMYRRVRHSGVQYENYTYVIMLQIQFLVGESLSEPHINGLSGAGRYGASYDRTSVICQSFRDQIYLHLPHHALVSTSSIANFNTHLHSLRWTAITCMRPWSVSMDNQSAQDRDEWLRLRREPNAAH